MKKLLATITIILLSIVVIISCTKSKFSPSTSQNQSSAAKVNPNVPYCGLNEHWDFYLGKCVPNCPTGEHNDSITGACVVDGGGGGIIAVITNPNNPYDYSGLQHNNGVTYLFNHVNPNSPTVTTDILHYTKVYESTISLDTTGFDSWYNYATAHGYFYLDNKVYIVSPNPLNTKLYNDGKISSKALNYLNSINNAIDNVISDSTPPSSFLYSRIANQLIVTENNIKNDGTLTTNEKNGLLRVAAIDRYTGAYWANYINNSNNNNAPLRLFGNFSWRRFWHADGLGAIGGAAGGSLGGWLGAFWGAVLGGVGGSAGYAILGD